MHENIIKTSLVLNEQIIIKQTNLDGVKQIEKWAQFEGWNPGIYESEAFYAADPQGFWLLYLDSTPIASIAKIHYSQNFIFVGLFIVIPEYRKQGYGKILWNKVIKNTKNQVYGLDAVEAQVPRYAEAGFKVSYKNAHYTYVYNPQFIQVSNDINDTNILIITDISEKIFSQLVKYDAKIFFSIERQEFLRKWINMNESYSVVAYNKSTSEIIGYGVLSKTIEGYQIAPLFADDINIAKIIYNNLLSNLIESCTIHIDTPCIHDSISNFLNEIGFQSSFFTYRMYTREPDNFDSKKIFGITTLDIG